MKVCLLAGVLSICAAAGMAAAASASQKSDANAEISKLDAFLGKWNTTGAMKGTPYSKAGPTDSTANCWSANHGFLLCDDSIRSWSTK